MSEANRRAFAAAVRERSVDLGLVCALLAAESDPDVDVAATQEALAALAERVATYGTPAQRLRTVLGGFRGEPVDYTDLRSSLLPDVLTRRRGLPILLSVVWLETARLAGVPAYGASLPGHFVVGLGDPGGRHDVVDPWRGGAAVAEPGGVALDAWDEVDIVARILANIRGWAASHQERWRTRLWAVELTLLLPRHSVALRRERGELLVRGGEFAAGALELETYADAVDPEAPDSAATARHDARMARARLN
jgi:regulator of sirC expression with transglutaminase-like and TPR domain